MADAEPYPLDEIKLRSELAALQAAFAREHARRCALETVLERLSLTIGQTFLDRAWAEMEMRHGPQERVDA